MILGREPPSQICKKEAQASICLLSKSPLPVEGPKPFRKCFMPQKELSMKYLVPLFKALKQNKDTLLFSETREKLEKMTSAQNKASAWMIW